jgi:hypothetical protein
MKTYLAGFAAIAMLATGAVGAAHAQDSTTVIHKESADGDKSKTVVKKDDGSKTVIKRHGNKEKKVKTDAEGDKTVVKKTTGE